MQEQSKGNTVTADCLLFYLAQPPSMQRSQKADYALEDEWEAEADEAEKRFSTYWRTLDEMAQAAANNWATHSLLLLLKDAAPNVRVHCALDIWTCRRHGTGSINPVKSDMYVRAPALNTNGYLDEE